MISSASTTRGLRGKMQKTEYGSNTGAGLARTVLRSAVLGLCLLHSAFCEAYQPREMSLAEVTTPPIALQYYKEHPERFIFKKPEDLPKDLKWEDGRDEPVFAAAEAKRGGTLTFGIAGYPPTLRRHGPNSNHAYRSFIYDNNSFTLIAFHPVTDGHLPCLAKSWAVSADKRTVYFRLDESARFSDGQPVSADDYFFEMYRPLCEYTQDTFGEDYYSKEFESITRYDDYTIAVTLPQAKPDPLVFASIEPAPRHFYRELGPDFVTRYQRRFEPTTGPYVILPGDDRTEQSLLLTRLEKWWGDDQKYLSHRFNPDKISLKVVREQEKSMDLFFSGKQDMIMLKTKYWYSMNDKPAVKNGWIEKALFYNDYPRPPYGLYLNASQPPLDNPEVRLGLHYATDWQRVINTFFRGDYDRLNQFAQGYGKFTDNSIKARPYDPDEAMRHFAKAGYTKRGPDGILVNKDGARLSVRLLFDDGDNKKMLPALIDYARKAGVEFVPRTLERATMYKEVMEKNHQVVFWAWSTQGIWPEFHQSFSDETGFTDDGKVMRQTNNITLLKDPTLTEMINRFRKLTDEKEMITLSKAMQRRIDANAVFIPGFVVPGYRVGYWRWMRFPKTFDVKRSDDPFVYGLYWIDEDLRRETEEAMSTGKSFGPKTHIFDEYRPE